MAREFNDPADGRIDLEDPLDRTAAALLALEFHTPEDVAGMLTGEHGIRELTYTWRRQERQRRHLYRRRAAMLVDVAYHGLDAPIPEA